MLHVAKKGIVHFWTSRKDSVKIFVVFVVASAFFAMLYLDSGDQVPFLDDQFFNIRYAHTLASQFFATFPQIEIPSFELAYQERSPFGGYPLFYTLLMPFASGASLLFGMKLYAVLVMATLITVFYGFLLKMRERYAVLYTLGFFALSSIEQLMRYMQVRAFTLDPFFLLLELYFLYRRKYKALFVIVFAYFLWHTWTFYFALVIALLYFAIDAVYRTKGDQKILVSVFAGLAVPLAFSFFVRGDFMEHLKGVATIITHNSLGAHGAVASANELQPVEFFTLLSRNPFVSAVFVFAMTYEILRYMRNRKRESTHPIEDQRHVLQLTLFVFVILLLLGSLVNGRVLDYFNFFLFVYLATSIGVIVRTHKMRSSMTLRTAKIAGVILLAYFCLHNALFIQSVISVSPDHKYFRSSALWLAQNTQEETRVIMPEWWWFTTLYYYNGGHNNFVVGLEPRSLFATNAQYYWAWYHMSTDGYYCLEETCPAAEEEKMNHTHEQSGADAWYRAQGDRVADYLRNDMHVSYIVLSEKYEALFHIVDASDRYVLLYQDPFFPQSLMVYEVR